MAKSVLFATTSYPVPDSIREIERINREALAEGMSYGRYVAMKERTRGRKGRGSKRAG